MHSLFVFILSGTGGRAEKIPSWAFFRGEANKLFDFGGEEGGIPSDNLLVNGLARECESAQYRKR